MKKLFALLLVLSVLLALISCPVAVSASPIYLTSDSIVSGDYYQEADAPVFIIPSGASRITFRDFRLYSDGFNSPGIISEGEIGQVLFENSHIINSSLHFNRVYTLTFAYSSLSEDAEFYIGEDSTNISIFRGQFEGSRITAVSPEGLSIESSWFEAKPLPGWLPDDYYILVSGDATGIRLLDNEFWTNASATPQIVRLDLSMNSGRGSVIGGNNIRGSGGNETQFYFKNVSFSTIRDNQLALGSGRYGFQFVGGRDLSIISNHLIGGYTAMYIEALLASTVSLNTFESMTYGTRFFSTDGIARIGNIYNGVSTPNTGGTTVEIGNVIR